MAKGRRTYSRDARGRFASGGGGGGGGAPKARMKAKGGANRLTRNNAGRITSVGGSGATARGGRLRTASGAKRGAVVARLKGGPGGTVAKPRGLKPGAMNAKALQSSAQKSRGLERAKAYYTKAIKKSNSDPSTRSDVSLATARRALDAYAGKRGAKLPGFTSRKPAKSASTKEATPQKPAAKPQKATKPAEKKGGKRTVSTAQVERMMQRIGKKERNYQAQSRRLRFAKQDKGAETKQRAVDFLYGKAGFQKEGKTLGRTRWKAPDGMTTEQATRNIAEGLSKLQRRSTARTGNKKITTREEKRAKKLEANNMVKRSVFFQRTQGGNAPKGLRQQYSGSTARGSKAMKGAAQRQSKRREVVRKLRGLGPSNSTRFSRGSARQLTIFGGTTTTYGKTRRR